MFVRKIALAALGGLVLWGCDSSGAQDGGDAGTIDAGPPDAGLSLVCDPHASAPSHFVDATDDWNLGPNGLALTGNKIISADLDGDGYPDLIVHSGPNNARSNLDPDAGPLTQYVHVLMNRPRPGGGRWFQDETVASGIFQVRGGPTTQLRSAQLAVAADIDNDGDLDLFSGTYADPTNAATDTGDRSEIMLNDGTGHFSLAPISDPHPGPTDLWPTSGAAFTDVNRDGVIDLFVGFWYAYYGRTEYGVQAQLYEGLGDGTFSSITGSSGLTTNNFGFAQGTNSRPAYGVTACDLDGDGAPELMVSAYGRQWNLLYQNDGSGHFSEVGQDAGFAGDDDRNYHDNQFFACYCTVHPSAPDCAGLDGGPLIQCPTPADSYWNPGSDDQPFRLNGNTFATFCGDMDGDGKPDLYSAEIHHWHIGESSDSGQLLVSKSTPGHIKFDRLPNAQTGLVIPHPTSDWNEGLLMVAGADLDNDARPDLIVAASDYPNQFGLIFHQLPGGTFEEVGVPWGIHHPCMNGLTVADFDRDGDLDVIVGSSTFRNCADIWKTSEVHFYQNNASENGNWLLVRLQGDGIHTNRAGIGARVTVTAGGIPQVQELGGGYGLMGMQNDTVLFFGLGNCVAVNSIEVRWPNQELTIDTWPVVPTNRFIELRQADPAVHVVTLAP